MQRSFLSFFLSFFPSFLLTGTWNYGTSPGGYSPIWVIRVRAAGQGMVFWPRCPKQGIQVDLPLS